MRGEYYHTSTPVPPPAGSPPLARGIHWYYFDGRGYAGITPACAGNTWHRPDGKQTRWDHPRLRGEYIGFDRLSSEMPGSPPLARGIQFYPEGSAGSYGITPACAGNTIIVYSTPGNIRDHPRLRGEYCLPMLTGGNEMGSPPLARGIHRNYPEKYVDIGITPACAGNTIPR